MTTTHGNVLELPNNLEQALASYRHKVFVESLGWELPNANAGLERDQFDRPDTVYVITQDNQGNINGCARLLPTTQPYLLGDVFPQLLNGAPIPCTTDVWELSRFAAVNLLASDKKEQFQVKLTKTLLAAALRCAEQHGAKRIITVSPVGIERLLHRYGVHAHRAGPAMVIDGYPIFACWIELDEITRKALEGY